jgi:hypothetical protein
METVVLVRRIYPHEIETLRTIHAWQSERGGWYAAQATVDRFLDVGKFLEDTRDPERFGVGIYEYETDADARPYVTLVGYIGGTLVGDGIFEIEFRACQRAKRETLIEGAWHVRETLFASGVVALGAWVCARNRPVKNILAACGFAADGARLLRGVYRAKPIEWERYILTREQYYRGRQKTEDSTATVQPEQLLSVSDTAVDTGHRLGQELPVLA